VKVNGGGPWDEFAAGDGAAGSWLQVEASKHTTRTLATRDVPNLMFATSLCFSL
jgi:hypothetical protein